MTLRAAVVGLGHQAVEDHLPGLAESEFADLVAVCDLDPDVLREQQYRLRVQGYTTHEDLFEAEELDLVIVAVPHHAGRAVIECAAQRGVHVLKEKPLATSFDEAVALSALCQQRGVQLMVTLQRRFNPIYTSFLQLVDRIGEPFFIEAKYTLFVEDPAAGWRGQTARAGGGAIIDMGYHVVDLLLWFFGMPSGVVASSSAMARPDRTYDAEDSATVLIRYDSGLHGVVILSRFMPPTTEYIRVFGTRGIVELERGAVRRLRSSGEVVESLSREHSWPVAAANQIDYFCRVIRGERVNLGSAAAHLDHMRLIAACYESQRTGGFIDPAEVSL